MTLPAYTVNADFENWAEGWTTSDAAGLTRLLSRAEKWVDSVGATRPIVAPATDTFHIIQITRPTDPGVFTLSVSIGLTAFTTGSITFADTSDQVVSAFASAGISVRAVGGPLPYNPVYVFYVNSSGGQYIPAGSVASSNLSGSGGLGVTFTLSGAGGGLNHRFNLTYLDSHQIMAVKNAVCAQADYMMSNPELTSGGKAQYDFIKGPDFTTKGRLPKVGPRVKLELAQGGLQIGMGRSRY